ncbi:GntR family transcriptional regulator [Fonticella tunisiensis]|uniref:DNA-binding GntR family transcriptional regulator n=1 Tax=Fonticella tunisiensis TaxID=1096341 RepID=A0A4V3ETL5_9CLOT|nr:GntR family transcriptional regulator [Fonticella tunisiensis]TDT62774.1 DNA-binding GntR family transcriptional regulator [Fonticella tunisiensis]
MINYIDEFVKNTNFNQNKPIREIVYEGLRKTIISGVIPVGERIVEKEYAERLNISRTPVREALRRLEMEELVEYQPRIGVIVKKITIEDVIEIYKIRHNLEVLAAVDAMENITQEEIKKIEELLDLTEEENRKDNVEEVIRLFGEFNLMIYKASRMKRLTGMISRLNEYLQRFRNISISDKERREKAIKEHRDILKAIVEKNKEDIDKIIKKHLDYSLEIVMAEIRD